MSDRHLLPSETESGHHVDFSQVGVEVGDVLEIELCVGISVKNRLVSTSGKTIDQGASIGLIVRLGQGTDSCISTVPFIQDVGSILGGTIIDNDQLPLLAEVF